LNNINGTDFGEKRKLRELLDKGLPMGN